MIPGTTNIEFCICTYDRLSYLENCLSVMVPQLTDDHSLTVVDNSPRGTAKNLVTSHFAQSAHIRYVHEINAGLNHARNAGWRNTNRDWIFYIDDDSQPPTDLIENATALVTTYPQFDAFGGPIIPLFDQVVPSWVPEGLGEFSMPHEHVTVMDKSYARGPCLLIKRSVLEKLNGFDPALGPIGKKLAFGDEIEFQHRMRAAGYSIAYAPQLKMGHHMRTEKLTLRWLLRSEFARRRDKMKFDSIGFGRANLLMFRTLLSRLYHGPREVIKATTNNAYPFKRALYETLKPLAFRFGEWTGTLWSLRHGKKRKG